MASWKSHVRAELFNRDCKQKQPFSGIYDKVSKLEERLDFHIKLWQDLDPNNSKGNESSGYKDEVGTSYLRGQEMEFLNHKLKQTISDLTSNIYIKEAELQYCHSQVARYRTEAVAFAQGASSLKATLEDQEYELECQCQELKALRLEQQMLREKLSDANLQSEQLLERWLLEKKEEAERINKHNATQERWQRLASRLKKRHRCKAPTQSASHSSSENKPNTDMKTQRSSQK